MYTHSENYAATGGGGQERVTKSSRMRGESDGLSPTAVAASAPSLLAGPGPFPARQRERPAGSAFSSRQQGGWAPAGSRQGLGRRRPRSPAPPSFRFGPPPTIGRWPLAPPPGRPRPAVPAPRSSPLPPAESLGDGGGGGRAVPAAEPRRREKRPKEEGEREGDRGSGERERAEAACRRRGGAGRGRGGAGRGAGEAGTRGARTSPQSANFPGECRARTFWARGKVSGNLKS